jgi:hypothetical protein
MGGWIIKVLSSLQVRALRGRKPMARGEFSSFPKVSVSQH